MFDFIWYILSPLTFLKFPSTQHEEEEEDYDDGYNDGKKNNSEFNAYNQTSDASSKPKLKSLNIPYYFQGELEDSIDLQIKSLVYVFHRFKISSLKPFLRYNDFTDDYDFDYLTTSSMKSLNGKIQQSNGKSILMNDKLDIIYNVDHFKKQLLNDPYRILVDYTKNKFRSLLILSHHSSDFNEIPTLKISNFNFLVLQPNDPIEKYIDIIINKSGIYSEHKINNKIKVQILMRIINRVKKSIQQQNTEGGDDQPIQLNKDDRAIIIKSYVQKLAFYIQVQRIYKAALKSKEREMKNKLFKFSTDKSIQSYKSLKSERSRMILLPESTSPSKNNSSNQVSIMDLDDTLNHSNSDYPYYSDTAESQGSSSTSSVNFTKLFTAEEKHVCFEQSKMAVRIRIERERSLLLY